MLENERENKDEKPLQILMSFNSRTGKQLGETPKETGLLEGCLNFDKSAPKSARICDADEGKMLKGKQYNELPPRSAIPWSMNENCSTARRSREKCS